ncbi:hypothetical protein DP939_31960 [Spongiactinospora rosea]|uniref:Uncharacterized protein n=1 Tax=Spongiactinospora rosea TaxID=2248750 RepID=A0A366LRR3_9ACTN|nr:hypothetical protein [Spongiactinospora rosea]RBQ16223.1 hypothetical protein DP939_31960 [Spongiactinospora rosea]
MYDVVEFTGDRAADETTMTAQHPEAIPAMPGLLRALARLALDADRQVDILSRARIPVDELALEYDDFLRLLRRDIEDGLAVDPDVQGRLREIAEILERISGEENSGYWTEQALQESQAWADIRERARATLMAIEVTMGERAPQIVDFD